MLSVARVGGRSPVDALEAGRQHQRERRGTDCTRDPSTELDATRLVLPALGSGTLLSADRLLRSSTCTPVLRSPISRLYELTHWFVMPVISSAHEQVCDEVLRIFDSPYSSPGSWNVPTAAFEQREVRVHPEPNARDRLRHERGVVTVVVRISRDEPERLHVVGHRQCRCTGDRSRVGRPVRGTSTNRDPHRFQSEHRPLVQLRTDVVRVRSKYPAESRASARLARAEVEEPIPVRRRT
jgi:hypothetical protein